MFAEKKTIILLSFLVFLTKWSLILFFNSDTESITKIIFNIDDRQYFSLIHNLANFNFNPTYNLDLKNSNFISFPFYSIIFHSIFFKLFNIYGFIFIEFFIILFFFIILTSFFNKIGLDKNEAIFLSLFFFCLPNLIEFFHLYKIDYVSAIKHLYFMRVPRPLISSLYLFLFFNLLISNHKQEGFSEKTLALIGVTFALMFSSFYYNLAICGIVLLLYYFNQLGFSKKKITKYFYDGIIIFIFFIIFSIPLIYILLNSEANYLTRVGLIELDIDKKKIILFHLIKKLSSINFLIISFSIFIFYYYLKFKNIYKLKSLNILLFIFFGSFLGPIIFTIISPTISETYHFSNMLVALTFFVFTIFLFLILLTILKKYLIFKNILLSLITIFLLTIFTFDNYNLNKLKSLNTKKIDNNELIKEIKRINIKKNTSILTFDHDVQTNLIFHGYTNFDFIVGVFTSSNDAIIENQLISMFKFFKLNENDFLKFIENKTDEWRYINYNIGKTFYMKYQANSLITFNDSKDFSKNELKFIYDSSPFNSQQLIIPQFEIDRLINKFKNSSDYPIISPNLVILNSNDEFTTKINLDNKFYCMKQINQTYKVFYNKVLNSECLM